MDSLKGESCAPFRGLLPDGPAKTPPALHHEWSISLQLDGKTSIVIVHKYECCRALLSFIYQQVAEQNSCFKSALKLRRVAACRYGPYTASLILL